MSGPKVVNIEALRRQQKRQGLASLRELERALVECQRLESQASAKDLLDRLHLMRDAAQWESLSIEADRQCGFYQERAERLRQQHADEHSAKLLRSHRLHQSIDQMKATLQSLPVTPVRDRIIGQLSSLSIDALQATLNEALDLLSQETQTVESSKLREFASVLTVPQADLDPRHVPSAPADPQEQRLQKCWNLLGELSALEDSTLLQTLTEKAEKIRFAPSSQRALLIDSLALELSSHLQNRRAVLTVKGELEDIIAELGELHLTEATDWINRISAITTQPVSLDSMEALARDARIWYEETFVEQTRLAQRAAVLQALAIAGYEVREGMAAAWAENGRIVLHKPTESNYGIEVSAPPQGSAFQTRVVALTDSRDMQRDQEIEETWCGELQKARNLLEETGFKTTLVQGQRAGTIPLKLIVSSGNDNRQRISTPRFIPNEKSNTKS